MSWNLDSDRPIFVQIIEHIELDIVSGKLPPGSRTASVRELAAEAAVNPNTMQRALSELERMGLMKTDRTIGRYITDDKELIDDLKNKIASAKTEAYLEDMSRLGIDKKEVISIIEKKSGD